MNSYVNLWAIIGVLMIGMLVGAFVTAVVLGGDIPDCPQEVIREPCTIETCEGFVVEAAKSIKNITQNTNYILANT